MQGYFEFFNRGFQAHEVEVIRELIARIDHAKERLLLLEVGSLAWQTCLEKLAQQRLRSSSSLRRGEVQNWFLANQWVQEHATRGQAPSWESLCEVNSILTGSGIGQVIREHEIYVGPYQACEVRNLTSGIDEFRKAYLTNQSNHHPLVHAALCHYVLVSLHPFADGNGRTSVMLADWLLSLSDYLPQSFTSKADGVVMYQPGRPTVITPGKAVARILNNILNSYQCFEAEEPS